MKSPRRQLLHLMAGAVALKILPRPAWAEGYPARPVRIVVGFGPGGAADIVARLLGQALSERLGQPFIIENRPGAVTNIATEAVVRAPADGYMLLLINVTNVLNLALYDKLNFDFIRDISPIASIAANSGVMVVNPSFPAKTVLEFVAYARANPGKLSMATSGAGSPPHIWGELFKLAAGIDLMAVPYRGGSGPSLTDLIAGQVQVTFDPLVSSIELIKAGKLRALAVTAATRSQILPEVPAIAEFFPKYKAEAWFGLGAPRNTSAEIIATLNGEINKALADPKLRARLAELTLTPFSSSPAEFSKFIGEEVERWGKVIRAANIKLD